MPTASSSAWSGGGGGASLHARQQRQRKCQGKSQLLTRRSATGQQFSALGSPAGGEAGAAGAPFFPAAPAADGTGRFGGATSTRCSAGLLGSAAGRSVAGSFGLRSRAHQHPVA